MFASRCSAILSRGAGRLGSLTPILASRAGSQSKLPLAALLGLVAGGAAVTERTTPAHCDHVKFPHTGLPGTHHERSFIAIKPDGVQRGLIGEIIGRFEKKGFKLVALKMIWPSEEMASKHYDDLKSKKFFAGLVKYFSSGPVVAMVWEGPDVILTGRKILGATNPAESAVGTIRGDLCLTVARNVCHGSDGPDSAKHEIGMWFTEQECSAWPRTIEDWVVADN